MNGASPLLDALSAAFAATSWLEIASVAFALAYLALAVRQNILCWPAGLIGTLLMLVLVYEARLYPETALQVFYAVVSVYGWHQWRHGGRSGGRASAELPVRVWPRSYHALAIGGTLAVALVLGAVLSRTNAAFPYLDSFTSVASLVTTYMVAKKVLENWVYWFVIDGLQVYIYWQRSLYLYAALSVVYLVLVVVGFYRWRGDWRAQEALAT